MNTKIREITLVGVLGAITIILGFTQWGYIPLPTPAGAATIMHIPVIITGIVLGAKYGALVGTIFGISVVYAFGSMFPIWVLFPARPLIGVFSAFVFYSLYKILKQEKKLNSIIIHLIVSIILFLIIFWIIQQYIKIYYISAAISFVPAVLFYLYISKGKPLIVSLTLASFIGSITNTIITLGLGVIFKVINLQQAISVGIIHGIPEAIVAIVLCVPISMYLFRYLKKEFT
ncbi:MAG: ECF transporter S component [Caldisericia bacterium]|nr:ECF transporter S component [Caldisericia bacterium]